jgi:hypothetical protein
MTIAWNSQRLGRWSARGGGVFCLAFAAFQVALALGAPFGHMTWGGSSPTLAAGLRAASAAAAIYLLIAAAAMLVRSRDWGQGAPQAPFRWFNWLLTIQLAANTAANLASRNAVERYGMGAASGLGFLLCLFAALFSADGAELR